MRGWVAIALCLLLAGCFTQAQIEAQHIGTVSRNTLNEYYGCIAPIENKPEYAPLYEKIGIATSADPNRLPDTQQLHNLEHISDESIAAGLHWYAEIEECAVPSVERLAALDPVVQRYFVESQNDITDLINSVVTEKPTYADINQKLLWIKTKQKVSAQHMRDNLQASLLYRHAEEVETRTVIAENVLDVAVSVALSLATRQTVLVHSQHVFFARRPELARGEPVRVTKCKVVDKALSCGFV